MSSTATTLALCSTADVPEGGALKVERDGLILAVFNLSAAPASIALPGIPVGRALVGHGLPEGSFATATVTLPPHGVAFFELAAR